MLILLLILYFNKDNYILRPISEVFQCQIFLIILKHEILQRRK